jgi:hypothetical protein
MKIPEFKLHSKGENWFHFRVKPDSICESFTVSYLQDGTVVMSGDYGNLVWRRSCFPASPDYGFPGEDTNLSYFAEKVICCEHRLRIQQWDADLARQELNEHFKERIDEEEDPDEKAELRDFMENIDISDEYGSDNPEMSVIGEAKMMDQLNQFNSAGSWGECAFGERYTDHFQFQFECLKSVSNLILKEVAK